jgi:hypothetical protein
VVCATAIVPEQANTTLAAPMENRSRFVIIATLR